MVAGEQVWEITWVRGIDEGIYRGPATTLRRPLSMNYPRSTSTASYGPGTRFLPVSRR